MNKYKSFKIAQLIVMIIFAIAAVCLVILNRDLYFQVSQNIATMIVCLILWILFILSFVFLYVDFRNLDRISNNIKAMNYALEADQLSGLANKSGIDALIEKYSHAVLPSDLCCITFFISNIEEVNAEKGNSEGNRLIRSFSDILKDEAPSDCFLGRNGASKFIAVTSFANPDELESFLAGVNSKTELFNTSSNDTVIEYSVGTAFPESNIATMQKLIASSDRRSMLKGGDNEEA